MSRKRGSTVAIEIVSNDDPCIVADRSRAHTSLPREPSSYPEVIDGWPATPLVTERELDIIETYLGQLIGDILKG
jgi:hypothetical protein